MGNKSTSRIYGCIIGVLIVAGIRVPVHGNEAAEREFTLKVLPLLKAKCFACHGDDDADIKGEFDVRSRKAILAGGESEEPAIVPGEPDESLLYRAVTWDGLEMPPKENDRLTADEIVLIRNWISVGAPWPSEADQAKYVQQERSQPVTADGVLVRTSGGLADEWTFRRYKPDDIWAFQPVDEPEIVTNNGTNPIDFFVSEKLKAADVEPAPQADPLTLIRRASYDLIGLPPSPAEVATFLNAWEKNAEVAWSNLIDRLLDSPHYGERWAQHWLDVVRYADTGGYSNDYERSNAWRYRDYVIRTFNEDRPYDQFVIEQLAGDELADESIRKRVSDDPELVHQHRLSGDYNEQESEWIVATGFLRMGPWDNAMVMDAEARQIFLDDVVNSVGQTFLATTMRCVRCHDHKFDPIPTRDYYRMYAAFAATQMAERRVPFTEQENQNGFKSGQNFVNRMLAFAVSEKNAIKEKQERAAKQWYQEHGREYVPEKERQNLPDEEKPPRHVGLDHVDQGQLKVREQDEWIWNRRLERYQPMAQSVYNGSNEKFKWNGARKLRINPKIDRNWRPKSVIYTGGSLEAPGETVSPGVLSLVGLGVENAKSKDDPWTVDPAIDGRRLALAKWIAHPDNPLTSRAIVNRIWQHHFTQGIARNPNNFGAKGKKPTHPELLDWLANDFVSNGWTIKRMHRLIMSSKLYRQSSEHPHTDKLRNRDPNNELLAYHSPRRLTAEELRDSLLAVTGELNRSIGGIPAMPEINMEVALQPRMIQFSLAPAYQPSPTREQRNRRTIYAYRVRGQADPFLELFNQPNPNESCEDRDSAAVTPQVFTLLNSDVITDRSIALAQRLETEYDSVERQVQRAFALTFGRRARNDELKRLTAYVRDMTSHHKKHEPPKVSYPTSITRSVVEELSGKPFEYDEILPVFENYETDVKPADVDPETRALADLCLLLFNSNEFVYIY